MPTQRLLALDLGDKRTGVAVGDGESGIATPVRTIECPVSRAEALIDEIKRDIDEYKPGAIVIGLPLNMDGTEGPQAKKVHRFAEQLGAAVRGLSIHLHDERLTSVDADDRMAQSGLTHGQKKARRDALAACAILRDYMESIEQEPEC